MENSKSTLFNVLENGIEINSQRLSFPLQFSDLINLFGNEFEQWKETDTNTIYMWHHLGLKVFVPKNDSSSINISIKTYPVDESFLPKNVFEGTLTFNNQNYLDFFAIADEDSAYKDLVLGNTKVAAMLSEDGLKNIEEVTIWEHIPEKKFKILTDKYKFHKIAGEKIEFADLNFKLAIIEELMYIQELIQPKFDVFEFSDSYEKRDIDAEKEGYDPIPEALDYFKTLEIDQKLAEKVTRIYQDGGNDIYMNITPYWDGENESFTILSFEDIRHFPNLKKMTLFNNDNGIYEELRSKGIDASPL